jgi:hypothetical protein
MRVDLALSIWPGSSVTSYATMPASKATLSKVIAGPPGVEIGSDYYKPLRDAFEHRKASKGRNKVVRWTGRRNRSSVAVVST